MKKILVLLLAAFASGCAMETRARDESPLSVNDLVRMTRQGVREAVLLSAVRELGVFPTPTPWDVTWMRESGVSERVIAASLSAVPPRRALILWWPVPWHLWWPWHWSRPWH